MLPSRSPIRQAKAARQEAWYRQSGAAQFGISEARARRWLEEVEARQLEPTASPRARRQLRARLHVADLMLARACAEGCDAAWEEMWKRQRPRLRVAARALTHDALRGEELADNLLGDLYGVGAGTSKLRSYSGLGSLEAWLCTLLAQAHVNRWRRERQQIPLEECGPLQALITAPQGEEIEVSGAERTCLEIALARVLTRVLAPVRLLLCLYFLDGHTLAEIGALLRVHESTVSRRLERALKQLRRNTVRELRGLGLRPAASEAVLHTDPRWLQVNVRHALRAQPEEGARGL